MKASVSKSRNDALVEVGCEDAKVDVLCVADEPTLKSERGGSGRCAYVQGEAGGAQRV